MRKSSLKSLKYIHLYNLNLTNTYFRYLILKNDCLFFDVYQYNRYNHSINNTSIAKIRNRCIINSKARSVYKKYRFSRYTFKYYASNGLINGVRRKYSTHLNNKAFELNSFRSFILWIVLLRCIIIILPSNTISHISLKQNYFFLYTFMFGFEVGLWINIAFVFVAIILLISLPNKKDISFLSLTSFNNGKTLYEITYLVVDYNYVQFSYIKVISRTPYLTDLNLKNIKEEYVKHFYTVVNITLEYIDTTSVVTPKILGYIFYYDVDYFCYRVTRYYIKAWIAFLGVVLLWVYVAPDVVDSLRESLSDDTSSRTSSDSTTSVSNSPKSDSTTSVSNSPKSDSTTSVSNSPTTDTNSIITDYKSTTYYKNLSVLDKKILDSMQVRKPDNMSVSELFNYQDRKQQSYIEAINRYAPDYSTDDLKRIQEIIDFDKSITKKYINRRLSK